MRELTLCCFFFLVTTVSGFSQVSDSIVPASYPGGESMLADFINQNLTIPDQFKGDSDFREVVVAVFEVNEEGRVINPVIHETENPDIEAEAIRLISLIDRYEPATKKGKKVKSLVELEIEFSHEPVRFLKGGRLDFSDLREVLDRLPDNEACDLGRKALFDGDHETSLALLNKCLGNAVLMAGERASSLYYRSIAHLVLEDTASFFQDIDAAIGLGGSWYIDAYLTRADMFKSVGKYFLADADYEKALMIDGKSIDGLIGRGKCSYARGYWEDARNYFKKSINHHPNRPEGYKALGALNLNRKELEGCIYNFSEAIKLGDLDGSSFFQRGMCYARSRDMDNACADWIKAKELGVLDAIPLVDSQCAGK